MLSNRPHEPFDKVESSVGKPTRICAVMQNASTNACSAVRVQVINKTESPSIARTLTDVDGHCYVEMPHLKVMHKEASLFLFIIPVFSGWFIVRTIAPFTNV